MPGRWDHQQSVVLAVAVESSVFQLQTRRSPLLRLDCDFSQFEAARPHPLEWRFGFLQLRAQKLAGVLGLANELLGRFLHAREHRLQP